MERPVISFHLCTRSYSVEIGSKLLNPRSRSNCLRIKLSKTVTSCPLFERYIACTQPRYPSPPSMRIRIVPPEDKDQFHPCLLRYHKKAIRNRLEMLAYKYRSECIRNTIPTNIHRCHDFFPNRFKRFSAFLPII